MRKKHLVILVIVPLLLLILVGVVLANSSASASSDWHVFSAGGAPAESANGQVSINGTLGQTAIGSSTAGNTSLWAGFWQQMQQAFNAIFMPAIMRGR